MPSIMTTKKIAIDETLCNGCGLCVPACAEGAIKIVDGKAVLDTSLCDNLGACLGECPRGAIKEIEVAVDEIGSDSSPSIHHGNEGDAVASPHLPLGEGPVSCLTNWPVQLTLVPPSPPYLKGADILLSADCVPFAFADFHNTLLTGKVCLVGCPKLDDLEAYIAKLTRIIAEANPRSISVAIMEVPCCSGLWHAVLEAIRRTGVQLPVRQLIVGVRGDIRG